MTNSVNVPLAAAAAAPAPDISAGPASPPLLSDTQRNGSIAGIAILLGFSLQFTAVWSQGGDPWGLRGIGVFVVAATGIAWQLRALFRILPLPVITVGQHAEVVRLFSRGVATVLLAYVLHITFDAVHDLREGNNRARQTITLVGEPALSRWLGSRESTALPRRARLPVGGITRVVVTSGALNEARPPATGRWVMVKCGEGLSTLCP